MCGPYAVYVECTLQRTAVCTVDLVFSPCRQIVIRQMWHTDSSVCRCQGICYMLKLGAKFAHCTMSIVLIKLPIFALFIVMYLASFFHICFYYYILLHACLICFSFNYYEVDSSPVANWISDSDSDLIWSHFTFPSQLHICWKHAAVKYNLQVSACVHSHVYENINAWVCTL